MDSGSTARPEPGAPRRVVTAPVIMDTLDRTAPRSTSDVIETLYMHPDVRIVAFDSAGEDTSGERDLVNPLAWSSRLERTVAVGSFRIYRAPGSVAFLSCGAALKPIMPKGQCWSITDNNSKFVLQIRRPSYWRIELPIGSQLELQKAQELREVFDTVLQFEKTPCPFVRPFTVPLPEPSMEPVKRKAWVPPQRSSSVDYSKAVDIPALPVKLIANRPRASRRSAAPGDHQALDVKDFSLQPASKISFSQPNDAGCATSKPPPIASAGTTDDVRSMPEGSTKRDVGCRQSSNVSVHSEASPTSITLEVRHSPAPKDSTGTTVVECSDSVREVSGLEPTAYKGQAASSEQISSGGMDSVGLATNSTKVQLRRRNTGFGSLRSAPSAPQLTLLASPPSKRPHHDPMNEAGPSLEQAGRVSPTCSQDSFHSTKDWFPSNTSLPPSPPREGMEEDMASLPQELPVVENADPVSPTFPATPRTGSISGASGSLESTPMRPSGHREAEAVLPGTYATSGQADDLLRNEGLSTSLDQAGMKHRPLSPLPPAATLAHPPNDRITRMPSRNRLRTLPLSLLTKSCGLLMRPPSFLVTLMLRIAARISAGEWKGTAMGYDPTGDQIPVDWGYSDSEWDEDMNVDHDRPRHSESKAQVGSRGIELQEDSEVEGFEDARQTWETD